MSRTLSQPDLKVFISYRREDSAADALHLFDDLIAEFGKDQVFMDIEQIHAGADFSKAIEDAVESCDVLLAVIGQRWLTITDSNGVRRLVNPNDLVRLEIATALQRNVRVIPVLVQGASIPSEKDLPDDLKTLASRHAFELRHLGRRRDVDQLCAELRNRTRLLRGARLRVASTTPQSSITNQVVSREDVEEIKRQLTELHNHIKPPVEEITSKYPGISLHTEVRLYALQENRRQYLYDLGQIDKDRFSVYLDPDNVLTVALVSSKNEPYNIRVSPSDVPMERFIFLSAEVAIRDRSTLLTASTNGTIVGKLELPFKVAPDRIDPAGAVIGADLNGQNGARFDMAESILSSLTLTSDEFKGLLENIRNKARKQYVEFNGSQWLRSRGKGKGAYQDSPEAAPRLRKFDLSNKF